MPNTMNLSCVVSALACILASVSLQNPAPMESRAIVPGTGFVPAVVHTVHKSDSRRTRLEDPDEFREQSSEEIESCALALEAMARRATQGTAGTRSYLGTRLQALREHVDYARNELLKLPSSQSDESFIPAHAHFYRTMTSLEQAFAQAANELNADI
jgi:hypothetical protein